ncbi:mannose/fructose/N-acetylgalactosamine-specific phosphotransferase system component IIC [Clostridium beijerinckii]|nr:mannose/fructose/N-acetylgalactosamine-specific phosphotransferase system component IIC [Clostridium beijerinckii]
MTTVIAYTTGADVKATIGLALPFSFLMQYVIFFTIQHFQYL